MSRQGASCIIGLPSMVKELYCSAFLGFRFFYSIWSLVVRERRLWQMFSELCLPESRDSCYPEEQYLPTLLDMADPAGGTRYTLMRVNWTDSVNGHPHTYVAPEVSLRLIAELRQSNNSTYEHVFARKFAPDCLGPLMAIADTVIFKN